MSDLLYYITAVTKNKKPRVVFLNDDEMWIFDARNAKTEILKAAKSSSRYEPTHCLFVESNDKLMDVLHSMLNNGECIYAEEFYKIVEELGCKTVSTRKKKKSKLEKESNPVTKTKPKIRIAYVLCYRTNNKLVYYEENMLGDISANSHLYINDEFAKVFRTREEAEFYNEVWMTNNPNNAKEMYVKEITF